ncbi:lamin tail domain-containing protein [Verrucomicrobiaceae bacterium 227]
MISDSTTPSFLQSALRPGAGFLALAAIPLNLASAQPVINEFVALNRSAFTDGDGRTSDWIEIYNPDNSSFDLSGYHLTDNEDNPQKYTFPAGSIIEAEGFMLVFASGQANSDYLDGDGFRHTTFSLSETGEYLAINAPNDTIIDAIIPDYPTQFAGFSYGRDASQDFKYFDTPTPGTTNDPTPLLGLVKDTKFSHDRGYYTDPFDLEITSATPGAKIYYTTDGTPPSTTNGTLYVASEPIPISATTTIRAFATLDGYKPTNVDTQTYLFVEDVIFQTRPTDYPTSWSTGPADYDMDPDVVNTRSYRNEFDAAFAALPTLSLVFDPDAFFHPTTGIYQNPTMEGEAWERPLSVEFIVPDNSEPGFQIDAGTRIQGGSSRNPDTPKHALSLRFRGDYGESELNYPLFENSPNGETAVDSFDLLQLRPEYNFGWMHRHWFQAENSLYGRDQWASDLFNSMGQNGSHGRWVHLFLNGIYWGLYDVHERPDADHMANYFGGKDEDYDTINSSLATNGDLTAYNAMMNLAYGSIETPATYEAIQEYLDLDAFIDYMIINAYIGNRDWDIHNWRAARKREPGAPFLFFPWDSEFAVSHVAGGSFPNPPDFYTTSLATNVTGNNGNRRPTGLHTQLSKNSEYRLRYADRIQKHFFNDGTLTPANSAAHWTARSVPMTAAIVAESARWGDFRRDVNPTPWLSEQFDLYTRNNHYLPTLNWLLDTYIPQRSDLVVSQLAARNLFAATAAPEFAPFGGTVPRGSSLVVTSLNTIYYTTDGSDPRLTGGALNPTATLLASGSSLPLNQSTLIKARSQSTGGEWSALTEATFTIDASSLVISEIMYHPADQSLAEFLEITNTSDLELSLTGLYFSAGITFDFSQHSAVQTLAGGERLLIIRDLATFQEVYGNTYDSLIAGSYQDDTALANSGETLSLSDANGNVILAFEYNDKAPWPVEADGGGHSLVHTGGDPALAHNWRASTTIGGNPGTTDSIPYPGGSLLDYALIGTPVLLPSADGATFTWTTPLAADQVTFTVQQSTDLATWEATSAPIQSQTVNALSGTRTFSVNLPGDPAQYARVLIQQR